MVFFIATSLSAGACSSADFPEYSVLGSLRVLSLAADSPEVAPGAHVTLTPFVSDLSGQGRALKFSVETCPDAGISRGADLTCDGVPGRAVVQVDAALTGLGAPNYTGVATSFAVDIPATALAGRSARDRQNGIAYLVFYTLKASDGESVRALKRITVSEKTTRNVNPVFEATQILGNDAAISALPAGKIKLLAKAASASAEAYTAINSDGSIASAQEELEVSWFVSDGLVDPARSVAQSAVEWEPPVAASTTHSTLIIAVMRDGRGGEAVAELSF